MQTENRKRYACVFEAVVKGATFKQAGRQCGIEPAWRVRVIVFRLAYMMRNLRTLDEPLPDNNLSLFEFRGNNEFWLRRLQALKEAWRVGVDLQPAPSAVGHESEGSVGQRMRLKSRWAVSHQMTGLTHKLQKIVG